MRTFDMKITQTYFSQINPMAAKIASDINNMKLTYGEFWKSLKNEEKDEIINETLIRPEISLWYLENINGTLLTQPTNNISAYFFDGTNLGTFALQKVALKHINDVKKCRDEHSFPFSYRTKSQINFQLLNAEDTQRKVDHFNAPCIYEKELVKPTAKEAFLDTRVILEKSKQIILNCKEKAKDKPNNLKDLKTKCLSTQSETMLSNLAVGKVTGHNNLFFNNSYYDNDDEFSELMPNHNCSFLTASSSEHEDDYADDVHCEDAQLLNNSMNLEKGFDFLKNW